MLINQWSILGNKHCRLFLCLVLVSVLLSCGRTITKQNPEQIVGRADRPNIIIFYVDDLGYGDLSSYGATEVQTPNIDALANNGIKFRDAHSPAATCTPSRYSLLTGQFAFRNNAAILPGDAPLIIDPSMPTLPKMLRSKGYATAVIGKWHLGLGAGNIDWNGPVKPGPLEVGFDYSFLIPATGDRVPTVYLENHHVINLNADDPIEVSYRKKMGERPLGTTHRKQLRQLADKQHSGSIVNGISRIGWMSGGKSAEWVDEDFAEVFTQKAGDFIAENKSRPFLLFFPFHDIHVPRLPHPRFKGVTNMGVRGDAIVQTDWMTGRVVEALKKHGLMENTLIIFSSDNGPVLNDGYADEAVERIGSHKPSGPFSGGKYSALEAGTRVPMITHFKGRTVNGVSDALISHIDFYASLAALVGYPLKNNEAIDSENVLAALLDYRETGRAELLEESKTLALREGPWKYIAPFKRNSPFLKNKNIRTGLLKEPQLYNLDWDIEENNNLIEQFPSRVKLMAEKLEKLKQRKVRAEHSH